MEKRMYINETPCLLFICNIPNFGGTRSHMEGLATTLLSKGYRIITLGNDGGIEALRRSNSFKLMYIDGKGKQLIFLFRLLLNLLSIRIRGNVNGDVAFANVPEEALLASLILTRIPIVLTLHGKYFESIKARHSKPVVEMYSILEKLSFQFLKKRSSIVVAIDESTREYYCAKYPWLADITRVVPVGINLARFRPMEMDGTRKKWGFLRNDKIVMYVGRLAYEKNLLFLLRAFTELKKRLSAAKLIFVGDGAEKDMIIDEARRLHVSRDVILLGEIDYANIPELINCADVIALCSHHEGSPHIIKEAVACGVPIVCTNIGDVQRVIRNEHIGYISCLEVREFASYLELAINRGKGSNDWIEDIREALSVDIMANKYVDIINELSLKKNV